MNLEITITRHFLDFLKQTSSIVLSAILLLVGLGLTGCSPKARFVPGELRMNLGTEPPSLDWHITTDGTSGDVIVNIMAGLTQYQQDLKCIPSVAKSWDVLDDGRRYVFHLRDDVFWTDGKPVTAYDFEYAWRRIEDPKTGGGYADFLNDVENAQEINGGQITDLTKLGAHALDEHTFEVRLKKPAAYFIYLTAHWSTYPMRKDVVEKHGDRWTEPDNIVTNGPFKLAKWQHDYKIELEPNEKFFEGRPKLNKVKMFMVSEQSTAFALFENDELDYVDNRSFSTHDVDRYRNDPGYIRVPLLQGTYLGFNVLKKPFDNKHVRRAVSMAIDKTVFPKLLRRGERPSTSWIPEELPGSSETSALKFNPSAARAELDAAGFPEGKNFPSVQLLYPNREDTRLIVESIQAQLKKNLGISIELLNQEWKVYLATRKKDPPPLFRANWIADYPDPETYMNLFTTGNGNNHTRWSNSTYDRLVQNAAGELNVDKRAEMYRQADTILCKDEAAIVPTFVSTQNILMKPWTSGLKFNALDIHILKHANTAEAAK
ncbi:peptide ABC transporter substrate-binding protein [Candidatus Obscuribacterales bacterium]|nr:peptide ABC transporter substrate-binding protein [Candidatus Obscuribacterales bacterium]